MNQFKAQSRTPTLTLNTCIIVTILLSGVFQQALKTAVIPLLKKAILDIATMKNQRPISDLPFTSKIDEKVLFHKLNYLLTQTLAEFWF